MFHATDGCVCTALLVGVLLVSQTTWAIIDEGGGQHQADISKPNIASVAKVYPTVRRQTVSSLRCA
jgi:hypothetical protein